MPRTTGSPEQIRKSNRKERYFRVGLPAKATFDGDGRQLMWQNGFAGNGIAISNAQRVAPFATLYRTAWTGSSYPSGVLMDFGNTSNGFAVTLDGTGNISMGCSGSGGLFQEIAQLNTLIAPGATEIYIVTSYDPTGPNPRGRLWVNGRLLIDGVGTGPQGSWATLLGGVGYGIQQGSIIPEVISVAPFSGDGGLTPDNLMGFLNRPLLGPAT